MYFWWPKVRYFLNTPRSLCPEDGGDMFLQNISWLSMDYRALYPRIHRQWFLLTNMKYYFKGYLKIFFQLQTQHKMLQHKGSGVWLTASKHTSFVVIWGSHSGYDTDCHSRYSAASHCDMWAVSRKQMGKHVATERLILETKWLQTTVAMDTKAESCKHLETKCLLQN
jgi:hypothetical protein